MSEKVLIYGGAFNPPTVAHQAILQAALDYAHKDGLSVWLMLSGKRSDKSIKVPVSKRIAYGRALLAAVDSKVDASVCTYELERGESTTHDTVGYLKDAHPNTQFTWLFGSDSIQTMPRWKDGESLLESLQMLVVQRAGYEVELHSNMDLLEVEVPVVSSTQVRKYLSLGMSVEGMVPSTVLGLL